MRRFKGLLVALSVLSLAGCSSVYCTKPVGEKAVSVQPEDWEGTWINSDMDNPFFIQVIDAEKGLLKAMWIDNMKLESAEVHLLESGEWMFVNLKEEDKESRFLWGRIKKDARQIVVWAPDASKISELVKAGSLPGTVAEDGDVILGDLKAEHLSLIKSEDKGILFDWTGPLVLIRLSK